MYPDITKYGYKVTEHDGEVSVDVEWDIVENVKKIKENFVYLTRGCACSKSKCKNRQCKCRKQNNSCGPGCRCRSCENIAIDQLPQTSASQIEDDMCVEVDSDDEDDGYDVGEVDVDVGSDVHVESDVDVNANADEDDLDEDDLDEDVGDASFTTDFSTYQPVKRNYFTSEDSEDI